MRINLILEIEKDPTNEVEDDAWCPYARDVAEEVSQRVVGRDFDTGWLVRSVKPDTRRPW